MRAHISVRGPKVRRPTHGRGESDLPDPLARDRQRLRELLAERSFERRPVTLSSGKESDFYFDCKQTVLSAEGHFLVGRLLYGMLENLCPRAEAIGGLTMGADPLASSLSFQSYLSGRPRDAFYVRKEAKGHGTAAWIEGTKNLRPNMPVVILEDVVTTGKASIQAVERAKNHGLDVAYVFAVVDRCEESGRQNIEKHAPFASLFSRDDFVE